MAPNTGIEPLTEEDVRYFKALLYDVANGSMNGAMYRSDKSYADAYNSYMANYAEWGRMEAQKAEEIAAALEVLDKYGILNNTKMEDILSNGFGEAPVFGDAVTVDVKEVARKLASGKAADYWLARELSPDDTGLIHVSRRGPWTVSFEAKGRAWKLINAESNDSEYLERDLKAALMTDGEAVALIPAKRKWTHRVKPAPDGVKRKRGRPRKEVRDGGQG